MGDVHDCGLGDGIRSARAAYFTPAIDVVKVQIKKAGVRLAMLIEAAAAGTMPEHLLKVTP
jgi:hypothetical protein